jgi:hypothetical protein
VPCFSVCLSIYHYLSQIYTLIKIFRQYNYPAVSAGDDPPEIPKPQTLRSLI